MNKNIKPYFLVKNNVAIEHSVSKYNIEHSINRNIIMKRINSKQNTSNYY